MAISVSVVVIVYCSAFTGLALLVDYKHVDNKAPFAVAFQNADLTWAYYVSGICALLATSDVSHLYVMPRMLYALGVDGLIFPLFCYVWKRTKVPIWSILIGGGITAIMALLFDIASLADMTSVGFLLSYSTVGLNVLIVRYNGMGKYYEVHKEDGSPLEGDNSGIEAVAVEPASERRTYPRFRDSCGCLRGLCKALRLSEKQLINVTIFTFAVNAILVAVLVIFGLHTEVYGLWCFVVALLALSVGLEVTTFIIMCMYEPAKSKDVFQLPAMPIIPCITLIVNTFLLMTIQDLTWARFVIWNVIGLIIYFAYGVRHSKAGKSGLPPSWGDVVFKNDGGIDANGKTNEGFSHDEKADLECSMHGNSISKVHKEQQEQPEQRKQPVQPEPLDQSLPEQQYVNSAFTPKDSPRIIRNTQL